MVGLVAWVKYLKHPMPYLLKSVYQCNFSILVLAYMTCQENTFVCDIMVNVNISKANLCAN